MLSATGQKLTRKPNKDIYVYKPDSEYERVCKIYNEQQSVCKAYCLSVN